MRGKDDQKFDEFFETLITYMIFQFPRVPRENFSYIYSRLFYLEFLTRLTISLQRDKRKEMIRGINVFSVFIFFEFSPRSSIQFYLHQSAELFRTVDFAFHPNSRKLYVCVTQQRFNAQTCTNTYMCDK